MISLLQHPSTAPEKPRMGEPCNGCGYCCAAETCQLAQLLMGDPPAPCPAMEFDAGRFWCGLVRNPDKYLVHPFIGLGTRVAPLAMESLGVGRGCDADDFSPSPRKAPVTP